MRISLLSGSLALTLTGLGLADSYHVLTLSELSFSEDQKALKESLAQSITRRPWDAEALFQQPTFRTPEGVNIYWAHPPEDNDNRSWSTAQGDLLVAIHVKNGQAFTGRVDCESGDREGLDSFTFRFDPSQHPSSKQHPVDVIRKAHYARLASHHLPGTAWFLHQADGAKVDDIRRGNTDLSDTFAILSGGRAISENIALDRELILGNNVKGKPTPIADIKGITVPPIDWKSRLPKDAGEIAIDPLATHIPEDQHVVFAPNLDSLFELMDLLEDEGAPVIQSYTVRNPMRGLTKRYREQMGLDFPEAVSKLLPIKSVAVTGGDPFFLTGTDVAVLFETDQPDAVFSSLAGVISAQAKLKSANATPVGSENRRVAFENEDRSFSAHLLRTNKYVAVANSEAQLQKLISVQEKSSPALGGTDEYAFFRHRYPLSDRETAFLYLSDATIRRWCGPRLRIGASRRTRAMAALSELTCQRIEGIKAKSVFTPLLGTVSGSKENVISEHFGSLRFLTPTSELDLTTATAAEKQAYERWRRGYESGWAQAFDPIALRILTDKSSRKIDLSVLPLTVGSDYRDLITLAGNSKLSARASMAHPEALLFSSLAIDSKSPEFDKFDTTLSHMLPGIKVNPLSWFGESISIYLDQDFFWKALANVKEPSVNSEELLARLPLGVRIESKSSLKLGLFITAVKTLAESAAPGLLEWETRRHGDSSYVVVKGNADLENISICYATMPSAWLLSLREDVLKRAIDREKQPAPESLLPTPQHAYFTSSPQFIAQSSSILGDDDLEHVRQIESWKAIPILNTWRAQFPGKDPQQVHLSHFAAEIHCPGGKGYRWNAKDMTMESVAYGHPNTPRTEAPPIPMLVKFNHLEGRLHFEDDGLRLRAELSKKAQPEVSKEPALELQSDKNVAAPSELFPTEPGARWKYRISGTDNKYTGAVHTNAKRETNDEGVTNCYREIIMTKQDGKTQKNTYVIALKHAVFHLRETYGETSIVYDEPSHIAPPVMHLTEPFSTEFSYEIKEKTGNSRVVGQTTFAPTTTATVTVPAGTFKDCIKVESSTLMGLESMLHTKRTTSWYKKGVGIVKQAVSNEFNTVTLELTEYHIPKDK